MYFNRLLEMIFRPISEDANSRERAASINASAIQSVPEKSHVSEEELLSLQEFDVVGQRDTKEYLDFSYHANHKHFNHRQNNIPRKRKRF